MVYRLGAVLALSAALGGGTTASAQTPSAEETHAIEWLRSASVDEVELGIQTLSVSGTQAGSAALCERLRRGLAPNLAVQAIEALEVLGHRASIPTLLSLAHARNHSVRARAIGALGVFGGADVLPTLRAAVDDVDPLVRVAAVRSLGRAHDAASMSLLSRAFDRGVHEAAEVICTLGGADDVRALLGHLGHVPLDTLLPGLAAALRRAELPQRLRLDVVARLADLGTQSVRVFFESVMPTLPGPASDPVKRAISDAILRISG